MAKLRLGRIVGSDLFGFFSHHLDLREDEIAKHKHILGIAGAGKSKLLEAMWLSLHRQGIGATFLDPQGSSAEFLLRALVGQGFYAKNPTAYDRVVYLEFADGEWMIPFNILRLPFASPYERVKLVVEAFKRVWPELTTAPMFDAMMDAALKILIDNDVSLAALPELLSDKDKRLTRYYPHAQDELAVNWFRTQWDRLPPRDQLIQGGAAIRRAYLLVSSPVAQLTLGQRENVLDVRSILDREQSVIINLGRVRDGETRKLLGAVLTHAYEVAALSWLPRTDLPHHHLLIDEFAQFAAQSGEALATMLDQTRKAGLFATLAGQTYSQLTTMGHAHDRLIGALANAMVKISFLVGPHDALTQARIFADIDPVAVKKDAAYERGQPLLMTPNDQYEAWAQTLKTLEPRHALVRVGTKKAVEIETTSVPTYSLTPGQIDAVKHGYFERYYTRRADVVLPHQAPWNQGKAAQRVTP